MNLNEILTAYEDLWRQAALEDRRHGFGGKRPEIGVAGPRAECAASIMPNAICTGHWEILLNTKVGTCPECGDSWPRSVGTLMTHLNDTHAWTWDMFANKFRDVLQQRGVDLAR